MLDLFISYFNFLFILFNYIIKKLTFQPPNPPGYIIGKNKKENKKDIYFIIEKELEVKYGKKILKGANLEYVHLHKEKKIKSDLIIIKPNVNFPICIIYCHGNCGDIGYSLYDCYSLAKNTNCIVISFEYPGYGSFREIPPLEKNIYRAIQNVYTFAKKKLNFNEKNIFLYGFSLGTGIAFDLACKKEFPISGLILQSPYLSIFRVLYNINNSPFFDIFKSCDKANKLRAPTLFIHGNNDKVIPYIHGRILAKLIPRKFFYDFYTVDGGEHTDLFIIDKINIYKKIIEFISYYSGIKIEKIIKQELKLDIISNNKNSDKNNNNKKHEKNINITNNNSIFENEYDHSFYETKSQITLDNTMDKTKHFSKIIKSLKNHIKKNKNNISLSNKNDFNSSIEQTNNFPKENNLTLKIENSSNSIEDKKILNEQQTNRLINIKENNYKKNEKNFFKGLIDKNKFEKITQFSLKSFTAINLKIKNINEIKKNNAKK